MNRKTGVKWIYIRSFGIVDSPEYKELVVPTPLLIHPDQQAFCYTDLTDRNPLTDAEYIIITIFESKTETISDNNH
jgi:hypothetical protein